MKIKHGLGWGTDCQAKFLVSSEAGSEVRAVIVSPGHGLERIHGPYIDPLQIGTKATIETNKGQAGGRMTQEALSLVQEYVQQGAEMRKAFFETGSEAVTEVARLMAVTLVRGGKILFCGNGGSAAEAQRLAAKFVSRFEMERPPLPALALTTDSSVLTAVSSEHGVDHVFGKQVKALGREGDVCVGISTTGQSPNLIHALQVAKESGLTTVGLLGEDGGRMRGYCDHTLCVSGQRTAHIQEVHMIIGHLLCRLVDFFLFEAADQLQPYL
mgnify:FL=1